MNKQWDAIMKNAMIVYHNTKPQVESLFVVSKSDFCVSSYNSAKVLETVKKIDSFALDLMKLHYKLITLEKKSKTTQRENIHKTATQLCEVGLAIRSYCTIIQHTIIHNNAPEFYYNKIMFNVAKIEKELAKLQVFYYMYMINFYGK